jgi:hypothetical protein
MIDWKEIYEQTKPLFDTYYQWQVVFVVGEGLFLIFFNWLIYKYLKKKKYAWGSFLLLAFGNIFFIYQSYYRLSAEIQVVQFQENESFSICDDVCYYEEDLKEVMMMEKTYCPAYPSPKNIALRLFKKAFDIKNISLQKVQNLFVLENGDLIFLKPATNIFIQVKDFPQHYFEFECFYREKFNTEERLEQFINEFKINTLNWTVQNLEQGNCKFECQESINEANYFYHQTYSIFIMKGGKYYPLILITNQGEIIYKITEQELKDYIF